MYKVAFFASQIGDSLLLLVGILEHTTRFDFCGFTFYFFFFVPKLVSDLCTSIVDRVTQKKRSKLSILVRSYSFFVVQFTS